MADVTHEVTLLLDKLRDGDEEVWDPLIKLVYPELKLIAKAHMRGEIGKGPIQATALVHEAYLRLLDERKRDWEGRIHFYGAVSGIMRRVLVDLARKHQALKRGGAQAPLSIATGMLESDDRTDDVLAIHDALLNLEKVDARQSRIVEMRFFCGMNMEEIARVLAVSERTVKREWRMARAWLRICLG
jgi:RNA polymerase sigma factor (TIGR02999 family)